MSVRFEQVSTLPWDINTFYEKGTKVSHDGKCYVSKKDVPVGVNIGMGDYWKKMELKDDVTELAEAVEELETDVGTLKSNTTVTVSETNIPFKFAYSNGIYGFMVGEEFHPFGLEVPVSVLNDCLPVESEG